MVTRDARSLSLFLLLLLLVSMMGGEGSVDEQPWAWGTPAAVLGSLRTFSTTLQSMFEGVASRRSARGDFAGAERARGIASTVGNTMQWWMSVGSFSWDYLAHYCFTQSLSRRVELSQAMGNFGDLSVIMEEVSKLKTDSERLKWIASNYSRALAVAKRLLQHLLSVFDQSGALRSFVMAIQHEVLEGDLLRDVFQMGPKDMEGLVQMCMEFLQRFMARTPSEPRDDDL